jgi:endoglucanase
VYFDDIRIEEIGAAGRRLIAEIDIEAPSGWYLWEGDASGQPIQGTGVVGRSDDAHSGEASITLSGTSSAANLGSDGSRAFLVTLGSTYEVTSWIKGENSDPEAMSLVRLDFYGYEGTLFGFDRELLGALFDDFGAWGLAQGVPLNVTSFGTNRATFERGLGGLDWVNDMIDVMRERGLHFAYYSYHQPDFGLHSNRPGLPDAATYNLELANLLYAKLHGE